jgi:hypothetical protein
MSLENQTNNNVSITTITNVFYSLSFYSPLIITTSIIVFSLFSSSLEKGLVFLLWLFVITFLRVIILKIVQMSMKTVPQALPAICLTGLTDIFIPNDVTYSTYVLAFTMFYFIMPMIMVSAQSKINAMNYYVIAFFIAYIVLDLFIKSSLLCIPTILSVNVLSEIVSGMGLGALIAGPIMYGTSLRNMLFINEVNSNGEVCSMPSKQKFKCNLYKNGELVNNNNL